jgi:IclR family acetate operon transcriptional repressor
VRGTNEAAFLASAKEKGSLATLTRGLLILQELAEASPSRGLDHRTLSRRLGMTRSTLYRYLATLQAAGYIEEASEPGRFRLGSRIVYLAAVTHSRQFGDFVRESVHELAMQAGEAAHATVYDHPYSVTVQIESGTAVVGPLLRIGSSRPLHCCASGKVFLAYEQQRVLDAYLATPLDAMTPRTITNPGTLRQVIAEVRHRGYATDECESYDGISGLAAPVFDFSGKVVGTLSITLAATRLSKNDLARLAPLLTRCAGTLSERLGRPLRSVSSRGQSNGR